MTSTEKSPKSQARIVDTYDHEIDQQCEEFAKWLAGQTRDSLAALTSLFERVWYGRGHADARDFENSMQQAEGLGCDLQ